MLISFAYIFKFDFLIYLMKREWLGLLLLGVLFILPFVLAEEQVQLYSGFDRFVDNAKLFFSSGDNKVGLALVIREKEVNSAMINSQNGDDDGMNKNLERATEKLQIVQERVSNTIAEEVKNNVENTIDSINENGLLDEFEGYVLEEQKTQLTAKLVIEVEGKEGRTLTREIVRNGATGGNMVRIVVAEDSGERVIELENQISQIQNQIAERIVKVQMADGTIVEQKGEGVIIKEGNGEGDNGLTHEVKTNVAGDGTLKNDPLPIPDLHKINPDLYDPNARAPGDTWEIDDDGEYAEGTTAEGANEPLDKPCAEDAIDCAD